jgi:hypothetical protein
MQSVFNFCQEGCHPEPAEGRIVGDYAYEVIFLSFYSKRFTKSPSTGSRMTTCFA